MKFLLMSLLFFSFCNSAIAQTSFLCSERFDDIRNRIYWFDPSFTIDDFYANSGDAEALGLTRDNGGYNVTIDEICQHVAHEIDTQLIRRLPRYSSANDEVFKIVEETIFKNPDDPNYLSLIDAKVNAWRKAKYGKHGATFSCSIKVSRQTFPVLITIQSAISADDSLGYSPINEIKDITYGDPKSIIKTIKQLITTHITKQSQRLTEIDNCP